MVQTNQIEANLQWRCVNVVGLVASVGRFARVAALLFLLLLRLLLLLLRLLCLLLSLLLHFFELLQEFGLCARNKRQ